MTWYAITRIDGVVLTTFETDRPASDFPDLEGQIFECAPDTQPGYHQYDGGFHARPKRTLDEAKAEARARIAAARWAAETGGTTAAGVPIATDDRSKTLISAAADRARRGAQTTFTFKGDDQRFVQIDAGAMMAIEQLVAEFVQGCFEREFALSGQIDAAQTIEAADAVAW